MYIRYFGGNFSFYKQSIDYWTILKNVIFKHCGTNTILTLKLAVIRIIISDVFNGVLFQQLFFHQYYNIQSVLYSDVGTVV